jgi:hypothetical protein
VKLRGKRKYLTHFSFVNEATTLFRIIHKIIKKEEQYVEDLDLIEKVSLLFKAPVECYKLV